MSFAFRSDTDMSVTTVCDRLTDTQPQTCTLDEVVEFYETLKHARLFLLGDAGTGVLTIEQQSVGLSLFIEGQSALIACSSRVSLRS